MLQLTLIFLLCAAALGGEVKLNPCPKDIPGGDKQNLVVESLQIEGCSALPCVGERGKSYTIESKVKFNFASKGLTAKITAIKNGKTMPVVDKVDICHSMEPGSCDNIKPGETIQRKRVWKVEPYYPQGLTTLRVMVMDDGGAPQYCGEFEAFVNGSIISGR